MKDRARLLELLGELSFERRDVVLASGQRSDFYIDCKQTALHAEGATLIGRAFYAAVERLEARLGVTAAAVGGMSIGADPLATATSMTAWASGRGLHAFLVRKTVKAHGTQRYVEGRASLPDGAGVILLEDVITTGGSTLEAAARCRSEGLRPLGVVVLVDRQAGGMARLEADGLPVEVLFSREDF